MNPQSAQESKINPIESKSPKTNLPLTIAGVILLTIIVGVGSYFLGRQSESNTATGKCYVGGCLQIDCLDKEDKNDYSTADCATGYTEEMACYKVAKCERQSSGQCGWTKTEKFNKCVLEKQQLRQQISPAPSAVNPDKKQQAYNEILLLENPSKDPNKYIEIDSVVDNFAVGTVGEVNDGSSAALWMKTGSVWKRLQSTQYAWSCKILLDNKAPPEIVRDCIFYENLGECKGYEKECAVQKERNNEPFIYKDLYEEKFGQ